VLQHLSACPCEGPLLLLAASQPITTLNPSAYDQWPPEPTRLTLAPVECRPSVQRTTQCWA